jgi:hypothetical protein
VSPPADPDERIDLSSDTPAESDEGPPRGPLVLLCSVLVAIPTLILLGICTYLALSLMVSGGGKETSPMTMLAVVVFPVPLLLILFFEHQAVVKRSAGASLMVGVLFLFPLVPGIASLSGGIKGLTGMTALHPDYGDWSRVAAVAGCLAASALIGIVHLHWWRCLMRWGAEAVDDEEPTEANGGREPTGRA